MNHVSVGDLLVVLGEVALVAIALIILAFAILAMLSFLDFKPEAVIVGWVRERRNALVTRFPKLSAERRKKRREHYAKRIRNDEPCPACGSLKRHVIKWEPTLRQVFHNCKRCNAFFAQDPVVKAEEWIKKATVQE